MPPNKINLQSDIEDSRQTNKSALKLIDTAHRAVRDAEAKADRILAPATLAGSESASAREIFESIDEQQTATVAAGLDPSIVFGRLAQYGATLAQSAKSRLVTATEAAQA